MLDRLDLSHDLVHVLGDLEQAHVQARVLLLVLVDEALKVLVNRVKERIDLLKTCLRQGLNLSNALVDHGCKLLPLIGVLLRRKVEFVEKNLAHLDDLLVRELEVFVGDGHFEV